MKTQVYYSPGRPRSYSAGSSAINSPSKCTPMSAPIKPSRSISQKPQFVKTKSVDENKPSATRYKTELCRPFQDYGFCRYGEKCQFAHGEDELRALPRHPKYKTELCRTYHTRGFCPYGSRCHFIHNLDELCEDGPDESQRSRSPTKTTGFNVPISPSLDSGISSPDDVLSLSSAGSGSGVFDFQSSGQSCGSDDSDCFDLVNSLGYVNDPLGSPPSHELDCLSVGLNSPTKCVSDVFTAAPKNLTSMMQGLNLNDGSGLPIGHRLPVFDTIMKSRNEAATSGWVR